MLLDILGGELNYQQRFAPPRSMPDWISGVTH